MVEWLGCDKCKKWHIVPSSYSKGEGAPETFECAEASWLPPAQRACGGVDDMEE